ncbi:MAG: flagellar type III secretion system pore protein FliP [Hyphomicrobiales bacterium]|nr:flagellar type III secretion system pore protein FliP [Hyphomicrobiales bacterium]
MRLLIIIIALLFYSQTANAQEFNLSDLIPQSGGTYSGRIVQGLLLLTVLSVAPGLLVTMTSFTRFIIAFSFLRSGFGLQSTPSNLIVISLALFMTYFVMSPVFEKSWNEGVQPLIENKISEEVAFEKITTPLKTFMLDHIRDKDLQLFASFSNEAEVSGTELAEPSLKLILPAFLLSELRRGFEIGFLILLPFLVIDLVVSVITMSMGMMMLPPTVVALPFKILFFVLMDGWNLIVGELLKSVL